MLSRRGHCTLGRGTLNSNPCGAGAALTPRRECYSGPRPTNVAVPGDLKQPYLLGTVPGKGIPSTEPITHTNYILTFSSLLLFYFIMEKLQCEKVYVDDVQFCHQTFSSTSCLWFQQSLYQFPLAKLFLQRTLTNIQAVDTDVSNYHFGFWLNAQMCKFVISSGMVL